MTTESLIFPRVEKVARVVGETEPQAHLQGPRVAVATLDTELAFRAGACTDSMAWLRALSSGCCSYEAWSYNLGLCNFPSAKWVGQFKIFIEHLLCTPDPG